MKAIGALFFLGVVVIVFSGAIFFSAPEKEMKTIEMKAKIDECIKYGLAYWAQRNSKEAVVAIHCEPIYRRR